MKKYSHAWIAFRAIKRLEDSMSNNQYRNYASNLIQWFNDHKDGVIQGAWYPDAIYYDMKTSHVLKHTPSNTASNTFKKLPSKSLLYKHRSLKPLSEKSFIVDSKTNLPDRCESIAHSIIDNLKMQESEEKGSPVSPIDNHIALLLFTLSHYVADAHMPFHCDHRSFSSGHDLHGDVESVWEKDIERFFQIDRINERFKYDPSGYPLKTDSASGYQQSILQGVDDELSSRKFVITYGDNNNNVWDFMRAVCQYSYLLSYSFIPKKYDHTNVPSNASQWKSLGLISFDDFSVAVLSDAVDAVARIWFRVWRRYLRWLKDL